ncbi:MAG: 16S rRNA (cytidine(1402)-2'-O)-methyltransferase [Bacillales bacterium]|nr:16S rRNA (cytidine(1402)-2'-O)-methyltransferase [Bacillales bacterium]
MERSNEIKEKNALYLIASPIGNINDISYRAIETLKSLNYLFCEDTRVTQKLLSHYGISLPLDSYHDYSDKVKEDKIISLLKEGNNVGIISDSGTPIISDPGFEVVKKALEENIKVIPIPGASAQVSALISSGLSPKPYLFYGFLDHKISKKRSEIEQLSSYPFTMVFYESPKRINETLLLMKEVLKERKVFVYREITKVFEEYIRLDLKEAESFPNDLKGEMVIVLEGKKEDYCNNIDIIAEMNKIINDGYSVKEAAKMLSIKCSMKSSDIYNEYQRGRK